MTDFIHSLQVRNYRVLKNINVRLERDFQVFVGPNGSGKSTLFDAICFTFDLIKGTLSSAIESRTRNFQDLVWNRSDTEEGFEISLELFGQSEYPLRYEIEVKETELGVRVTREQAFHGHLTEAEFGAYSQKQSVITEDWRGTGLSAVFIGRYQPNGDQKVTRFFSESYSKGTQDTFAREKYVDLKHSSSAIQIAESIDQMGGIWAKGIFDAAQTNPMGPTIQAISSLNTTIVQTIQLDGGRLKEASPINGNDRSILSTNGHNLPWVVKNFKESAPERFSYWIDHLKTELEYLDDINTVVREDDRHAYLQVKSTNGVAVPSWGLSEGTLRLIALTLLAYYQPELPVAYLVEEPENGIHPMAVEAVSQSLSSIYGSQVFVATHSPIYLRCVTREDVLLFSRSLEGICITRGINHPRLRGWQTEADMDMFFASDLLS